MVIDGISKGIVIDHITAGKSSNIYNALNLDKQNCVVAIIKNAKSKKCGKKDLIKIENNIDIDTDILGFIDPNITINIIENEKIIEKKKLVLPTIIKNVVKCKNPRCITSIEQEIVHTFRLVNEEERVYRCIYCEQKNK